MVQPKILSCIRLCAQKTSTKVEYSWGMCFLCTKYLDGALFSGLQFRLCLDFFNLFFFFACIIIEFIAADFCTDSCSHVKCLLITEGC